MYDEREEDLGACADCETPLNAEGERIYAVAGDVLLCVACAVRRGGRYDESEDRWVTPPNVDDLLNRLRPELGA